MKSIRPYVVLGLLTFFLFILELVTGSTALSVREVWAALVDPSATDPGVAAVVREVRMPQAITALLAGMGLAVGGLFMQTIFRNPLAGPSVMGVSSGASLGVAVVMLAHPLWASLPIPPDAALMGAAMGGALAVLSLVMFADRRVGDGVTLLIVGLLISYLCSALVSVLQSTSSAQALQGFVFWGMGSFGGVSSDRLLWLAIPVATTMVVAVFSPKTLNALLLGDDHATTLGVDTRRSRRRLLWITGIVAGAVTACCGPIAFIGMVTPHLARGMLRTNDHAKLIPATVLCGGALALLCDLIARSGFMGGSLPLNAVTSLLGAPMVGWVLFSGKRWAGSA
ncbi:MAG: iron ABC transporter permease [Flavobacteriales bacterium]|nr:iron ABC transporter permease [Flavobacteriales bacterium]MCC6936947.1 iron ABC transporter permease [Flavobacteriales bacterium]